MHEETQYLDLVKTVIERGHFEPGRNGNTYSIFGTQMRFSLNDGVLPLLTTKKLAWKTCFRELLWFIRGQTDNRILNAAGVHIWDKNGTREFLDGRGLNHLAEGDLGPVYGHQWRHFGAEYGSCEDDYTGKGVDQLQQIIDQLKDSEKRGSRRLVMTAWNPIQLDEMVLPPCHVLVQFNVRDNKYLSCSLYQRSGDIGLGVPFNIASYSFLTHMLAHHCGLVAEEFVYTLGNAHIYEEHVEALRGQLLRDPLLFPKIHFIRSREKIDDYEIEDVEFLRPYVSCDPIKMDMKA
jgi:thymidylate synthase